MQRAGVGASCGAGVVCREFGTPTAPQELGWPQILAGKPMLISAPTGSGKTLAAFLICIDRLIRKAIDGSLAADTAVVYVSPLKALSNDVEKNLAYRFGRFSSWPWSAAICARRSAPRCARAIPCRPSAGPCSSGLPTSSSPRRSRSTSC